jgi:8-oxo-dGTP diphosphatase
MTDPSIRRPIVAIRAIAQDPQGRILLLKRAHSDYGEGQWCLPGGKLDYGVTPEYTVEKELQEEAGLAVSDVNFLFYQNSSPSQPGAMHCVNLYFTCSCTGAVSLNEESSEFVWVTARKALEYKPVFGADEAIRKWINRRIKISEVVKK